MKIQIGNFSFIFVKDSYCDQGCPLEPYSPVIESGSDSFCLNCVTTKETPYDVEIPSDPIIKKVKVAEKILKLKYYKLKVKELEKNSDEIINITFPVTIFLSIVSLGIGALILSLL